MKNPGKTTNNQHKLLIICFTLPTKKLASTNRHAIEISSNTRTQASKLFGSSLRGNPYNLGFSIFHVNSVWCDPHLVDLLGDLLCLISAGSSGRTCVLLAVPYCWARAETLRGSGVAVKPERPFSGCHAPHSSVTWYSCRSTYVRRWLRRTRAAALGALPSERSHPSGDVGDVTPMQGDDPSGEVAVLALDEPALEEPCAQRLLIGPVQDR